MSATTVLPELAVQSVETAERLVGLSSRKGLDAAEAEYILLPSLFPAGASDVERSIRPRNARSTTTRAHIDRMVKRIVKQFHPERVILFGSHARGEAGPDSDVDLLVVMPVQGSVRDTRLEIRGALHDMPFPLDVLVTTPEEFAWRKELVGTIEWPAAREGKVLYVQP